MEITTLTRLDARYPILILPFCEFCFSFPFHFSVKNYSSFETLYQTRPPSFSSRRYPDIDINCFSFFNPTSQGLDIIKWTESKLVSDNQVELSHPLKKFAGGKLIHDHSGIHPTIIFYEISVHYRVIIWEINTIYEDIFQRIFEGERTHWHLKLPRESNSHFKVGTGHKEQVV